MLIGDNFEIPAVGLRGVVTDISPDEIHIQWEGEEQSTIYTAFQARVWTTQVPKDVES